MKDERSINAVDVAIAFGEGKATREELDAANADAAAAYAATYAANADAANAAYAAAYAANAVADAAAYFARRRLAVDICRQYIGEALIEKVNQLLNQNE
jgi:pyruvate/2-oxoglutarate dehydrogenase complex dihydrolipoamide acyltransferase (E2) component